jgi:predicted acylesterase/phospholipase RssA
MGMSNERDTALVLSGGSINGVLMELGFLRRLRESALWPRIGWVFGTSAGALVGAVAASDRIDDFERFVVGLQPADVFRPNRLWRLLLLGTHEYSLPDTMADRIGDPAALAAEVIASEVELVVCATDMTERTTPAEDGHAFELVYSSREHGPEELARAILASAAMSGLVPPQRVGDRIATDGGWTRNFPLGHAYDRPEVQQIVAFRLHQRYPTADVETLVAVRRRLERFGRVPPIRGLVEELREAEERARRGEPAHAIDALVRLMRVAVVHNTDLEERQARAKDTSIRELRRLRQDVAALVGAGVRDPRERRALLAALDDRFAQTRFPFRHDRLVPRITVRGSVGEVSLEAGRRARVHWPEADKRALIERGYDLADQELTANGYPTQEVVSR